MSVNKAFPNDPGLFRAIWPEDGLFVYCAADSKFPTPVLWETVGMMSGLKDKDDNDIYSGDIIKYQGETHELYFEVVFAAGAFGYVYCGEFHSFAGNSNLAFCRTGKDDNIEVVGNIHQNPELLPLVKY